MMNPILIDKENPVDEIVKINLAKDIVFVSPSNTHLLNWNPDGRISILAGELINPSILPHTNLPHIREMKKRIRLKMSFPKGITSLFQPPRSNSYLQTIPEIEEYYGFKTFLISDDENKIVMNTISPDYFLYNNIFIKFTFDMKKMKDENPKQNIYETDPICDLYLLPTIYFKNFNSIYYIKNDYIFKEFNSQIS